MRLMLRVNTLKGAGGIRKTGKEDIVMMMVAWAKAVYVVMERMNRFEFPLEGDSAMD